MKLFLIGMMGTGKSHWAKYLSKKVKSGCYDLDYLVETSEEKTITEIFAEDGEEYFRKAEAKVLRWFAEKKTYVLAAGGGTPCYHDNMEWMNKQGITIWIDEPVETLVERAKQQMEHRPAIKGLSDAEITQLFEKRLAERHQFYSQAKYHLAGADITEKAFLKIVKEHA
ncbi:shikimate kinase [Filimonas zeae]|uniref:Shikimate kinase n=1 Tax=Filimonas zeae TaxID=1737353 RepID=A0A917J633_9BACT|nr:shikimate kinase [Filimonas zeae]MDR6342967.1 shikimate kinase [Filimonas zeae]GGH83421.1 shikimate kinase [Filimonas zeae]